MKNIITKMKNFLKIKNYKDVWILTYSGIKFYPFNPKIEDVSIEDIAHALSNQCRFSGHTYKFYSVAQHSRYTSQICEEDKLWGLLHDATEAYFIDVPSPIKNFIRFFKKYEKRLAKVIAKKFDLPFPIPQEVHRADKSIFNIEWDCLMNQEKGFFDVKTDYFKIEPETPEIAKQKFLDEFYKLTLKK